MKANLCFAIVLRTTLLPNFSFTTFLFFNQRDYFFPLSSHLTINVHCVNNTLQFIFCGVFTKRLHKCSQLFCRNVTTLVLVKVMKSFEILCVKNNKIFLSYWFDITVTVTKWPRNKMERVEMEFVRLKFSRIWLMFGTDL